jgi:hypothetical protein
MEKWETVAQEATEHLGHSQGCKAWEGLHTLMMADLNKALNAIKESAKKQMVASKEFPKLEIETLVNSGEHSLFKRPVESMKADIGVVEPGPDGLEHTLLTMFKDPGRHIDRHECWNR